MHLHRSFFLTCNLQLHQFFRKTFTIENLLRTGFKRRILWKTENRHSYYNKDISWCRQHFQKTDIARESVYLRNIDRRLTLNLTVIFNSSADISFLKCVTKIFCISCCFQKKYGSALRCSFQWLCLCIFYQVKELISCKHSI